MEVSCNFSRVIYISSGVVSANVQVLSDSSRIANKYSEVCIQGIGNATVDNRWSKLKNLRDYYDETILNEYDTHGSSETSPSSFVRTSMNSSLFNAIFFQTKQAIVPFVDITSNNGIIVQFNLPQSALSSFKGLSFSVQYNIVLKFVGIDCDDKYLVFPFQVYGFGSQSYPYQTRLTEICVFPIKSITNNRYPLHQIDIADHDYRFEDNFQYKTKEYTLSESNKTICVLDISSLYVDDDALVSYAGNVIHLKFKFLTAQVRSSSVQASIVQTEKRLDDSIVQEQIISTISRCSADAVQLQAKLHVPDATASTFETPTGKISYSLRIEIQASEAILATKSKLPLILATPRGAASGVSTFESPTPKTPIEMTTLDPDNPFLFILPLKMVIPPTQMNEFCNIYEETLSCLEPAISIVQTI